MVLLRIKVGVANPAAGVQARGAVLSVVVPRAGALVQVVRVVKVVDREVKARTVIKARKSIMDNPLF